jgi:hypothetical protein
LKPSGNEPTETRFGDCWSEKPAAGIKSVTHVPFTLSPLDAGCPYNRCCERLIEVVRRLREGSVCVKTASETRGTTLCSSLFSRSEAFVTSASLLAYARNYCLRCRFVSV